ncbi:MAG TPA: tetratricopeptide repeat protein [Novosphingobium sp.]|nr:tetratricopeptide repeat protein [Novosphingobium sp.]
MTTYRLRLLAPATLMLSALMVSVPGAALAASPTLAEVSAAAHAGQVDKALDMMGQVLKDHPDSAKAHFVEAELLAKQRRYAEARTELAKAESLKPGLPFVRAQSVTALKQQLNGGPAATTATTQGSEAPAQQRKSFPWVPVVLIGALVFGFLAFLRRRSAANAAYQAPMSGGGYNPGYGPQGGPYGGSGYGGQGFGGPGYGGPGYAPPQQGGLGSGILGGLATGAAAGAGFAAGERVVDSIFGNHNNEGQHRAASSQQDWDPSQTNTDMGGDDFGISGGDWDDGGSSGGGSDDW